MTTASSLIHFYTEFEQDAFHKIVGMNEILSSKPADLDDVCKRYPDAVFAIMIHEELLCRHRGVRNIVQKAHASIMNGENMDTIRFRYNKELDEYFREHSWDD